MNKLQNAGNIKEILSRVFLTLLLFWDKMAPRANRQLIAAAELGDENGILQALEHGANINYQESSELETALIKAAENGHLNAVQVLLENKAVISVRNRLGWTALHQAAFYGHAKIVEAMIEHGGDVDIKNGQQETPVMLAACYGRVRAVKVLLDHGARADCCDWRGKSAMGYARSSYTASKEEKEQCIAMLQAVLSGSMVLKSKNRAKTKKEQGNAAFRKGDYNRAAILYSDAIKEDPSNHLLYSNRSAAFLEIGRYMLAKEDAIKCIGLNNKFTKGYLRNALANMALGEFEMVERDTRDGLKQNPSEEMTEKLLKLQRKATNARRERDTISEDVIVGEVKGFPASNSMHASRNPIFASGQSEDGLVKVWVTNRGHIDAGTFNGQITLGVLVLNNDDDTVIVDNYDKSFLLTLRNESTQAAIKPECTEIDGESVHGKNLKTVRLRQSQWAVFNLSFLIPAGIVLYENEALKKCHDLVVNFKSSGVEDGVMCHFDLTYIREFYSGFRPGLVCSRFGPPPNPLNPAWFKVQGWSGKDDEYTDYDDEK